VSSVGETAGDFVFLFDKTRALTPHARQNWSEPWYFSTSRVGLQYCCC